jgi:hypothetical protein
VWDARPSHVREGHWCPYCARNRKATIQEMRRLAASLDGECLSQEYVNMHTRMRWRCKKGHEWEAVPNAIKRHGNWCPECAGNRKLSIADMHALAQGYGGRCLPEVYINARTKLSWECAKGHQWEATPDAVRNKGRWMAEMGRVSLVAVSSENTCTDSPSERRRGQCAGMLYRLSSSRAVR